jgi:hypothetical protein
MTMRKKLSEIYLIKVIYNNSTSNPNDKINHHNLLQKSIDFYIICILDYIYILVYIII